MPLEFQSWSLIIPAAGSGKRLGLKSPKILCPIAETTILEILSEKLFHRFSKVILVISPKFEEEIKKYLDQKKIEVTLAYQNEPLGMAHAIACGLNEVTSENAMILWGDQVNFKTSTLEKSIDYFEKHSYSMVIPTYMKRDPYIHFQRGADSKITHVLQRREGDLMPEVGENDGGAFFVNAAALRRVVRDNLNKEYIIGRETKEMNFLPLVPEFQNDLEGVSTLCILDEVEAEGINYPHDILRVRIDE